MESPTSTFQTQNTNLKKENQRLTQENQSLNEKIKHLQQQMAQLLHQKSHSESAHKQQVAPKKCSHGHNHNHDHSHGHGHGHSHGHGHGHSHGHGHAHNVESSSEQQNPSEPSTPVLPPTQKAFLQKIFKTQEEINFKYFRLPAKTVKAWKKDENIDLTKNKSCMLHLREMKLNVSDFVNQKWQEVEWINLPECEIDDQGWRMIVENAEKSFPDLRVLGIRWNKIKTIKQGDLQHFKDLRMIDLGLESQENNPLSQESREVLKKFAEKHPNIKVD